MYGITQTLMSWGVTTTYVTNIAITSTVWTSYSSLSGINARNINSTKKYSSSWTSSLVTT